MTPQLSRAQKPATWEMLSHGRTGLAEVGDGSRPLRRVGLINVTKRNLARVMSIK
jgi:hypothetical protein